MRLLCPADNGVQRIMALITTLQFSIFNQLPSICSANTQPRFNTILGRWVTHNKAMEQSIHQAHKCATQHTHSATRLLICGVAACDLLLQTACNAFARDS